MVVFLSKGYIYIVEFCGYILQSDYLHLPSLCSSQFDRPIESNMIDKNSVPIKNNNWSKHILYIKMVMSIFTFDLSGNIDTK